MIYGRNNGSAGLHENKKCVLWDNNVNRLRRRATDGDTTDSGPRSKTDKELPRVNRKTTQFKKRAKPLDRRGTSEDTEMADAYDKCSMSESSLHRKLPQNEVTTAQGLKWQQPQTPTPPNASKDVERQDGPSSPAGMQNGAADVEDVRWFPTKLTALCPRDPATTPLGTDSESQPHKTYTRMTAAAVFVIVKTPVGEQINCGPRSVPQRNKLRSREGTGGTRRCSSLGTRAAEKRRGWQAPAQDSEKATAVTCRHSGAGREMYEDLLLIRSKCLQATEPLRPLRGQQLRQTMKVSRPELREMWTAVNFTDKRILFHKRVQLLN